MDRAADWKRLFCDIWVSEFCSYRALCSGRNELCGFVLEYSLDKGKTVFDHLDVADDCV